MENKEHCPFCKRVLLIVKPDGKLDLAGRATIQVQFPLFGGLFPGEYTGVPVPGSAKCLRLICKIKYWWRFK